MRKTFIPLLSVALLISCKDEPSRPPADKAAKAAPQAQALSAGPAPNGWMPLKDVEEPADVILLGAWEHPDYISLIKVKLLDTRDDVADYAQKAIGLRLSQNYELVSRETYGAGIMTVFLLSDERRILMKQKMFFRPYGSKILLVMGAWDSDHEERGSAAFDDVTARFSSP